jgi:hypothetical protein
MTRARKDIGALVLTALGVGVLAATARGWDVPLVGSSHRFAAVAVLLLGMAACSLGAPQARAGGTRLLAGLGTISLVLVVVAIATGSIAALAVAVACSVALWLGAVLRHLQAGRHAPVATA